MITIDKYEDGTPYNLKSVIVYAYCIKNNSCYVYTKAYCGDMIARIDSKRYAQSSIEVDEAHVVDGFIRSISVSHEGSPIGSSQQHVHRSELIDGFNFIDKITIEVGGAAGIVFQTGSVIKVFGVRK